MHAQGHRQERAGTLARAPRDPQPAPPAPGTPAWAKAEPMGCQDWALPHRDALPLAGPCAGARCCYDIPRAGRRCAEMPGGGSPLLSRDPHSAPGTSAGASRGKPNSSYFNRSKTLTTPITVLPQLLPPFSAWCICLGGPTLSLHRLLQTAGGTYITTQAGAELCMDI